MKTKIKRHSRSVISVLLAVCMLASCMAVGIIATNAAYIGGSPKTAENAKANTADVAGDADNAADTEDAAVGAKAPEAVGASVDSDLVGWTQNQCYVHYSFKDGSWTNATMNSSGIMSITTTEGGNLKFYLVAENWWYKGKEGQSSISSVTTNNSANYYAWYEHSTDSGNKGDKEYTVTLPSAGTYNFSYVTRTKKGDQENAELQFHFWKTNTSYTISYGSTTNGSFTTAPTSATSGSTVTVVATPSTGYQLATFTVTNSSTSATITTSGSGNTKTFTMPSANVTVNATFTQASYTVSANCTGCAITGLDSSYHYGDTVAFTVAPNTDYALKSLTVKQGSTTITTTNTGGNAYTFTMPAGNVTITAVCANTAGTATIYFKSATAYVYVPYVSVNGGAEVKMTVDRYLTNSANSYKPKSETGSLRYAWYKAEISGLNTTSATTVKVRGQDTYMEATGSFNITDGGTIYLACDNLMEGSTLVDISSLATDLEALDFYDTPLNMIDN